MPQPIFQPSRFNLFFQRNGTRYLYNTLSGSFVSFPDALASSFERLEGLAIGEPIAPELLSGMPSGVVGRMREGGFIIPIDADELACLEFVNSVRRCARDELDITVALTEDCNMRCPYCFEHRSPSRLTQQVLSDLLDFIAARIDDGARKLNITWFGGEPLLEFRMLCEASRRIQGLCRSRGVEYIAGMVTNGVLLTPARAKRLAELSVSNAQITLDGTAKVHDRRRPLRNGRSSYAAIVRNIEAASRFIKIGIRCNTDRSNEADARAMIDDLASRGIAGRARIYFAMAHDAGKGGGRGCSEAARLSHYYTAEEFAPLEHALDEYAASKGFERSSLPQRRFNTCSADCMNSIIVEPDGGIQKCWELVGSDAERVGTLKDGLRLNKTLLPWLNFSPFKSEECRSCRVLPICMGWCPLRAMRKGSESHCHIIRYNICEKLISYHLSLVKVANQKEGCDADQAS